MLRCLQRLGVSEKCLIFSSQAQTQSYFPASCLYTSYCGFHMKTKREAAQQNRSVSQNKTLRESQDLYHKRTNVKHWNQEEFQSKVKSSHSLIDDIYHKQTSGHLPLYKLDGLDPIQYTLIYNNVSQTEHYRQKRFAVTSVLARICICWMMGNMAFVCVVDHQVVPQHIQYIVVVSFILYMYGIWRFMKIRRAYMECILRLYRENHGLNKKYVMIKPYKFMSTKQKVFSQSDIKKLHPERYPEHFKIDWWQKHHLKPENFIMDSKKFLSQILGNKQ
ncbi:uncharacterized protein LOC132555212 [Ylistrum balloti]|uniref:uncharacterized protein LOC132555212 n=1 Tax=Ylistrum balloti TaxID=509963 RepID=UPI0029059390|nr:uncharacterized protein LOC132555212 [Ylistrum balloti]